MQRSRAVISSTIYHTENWELCVFQDSLSRSSLSSILREGFFRYETLSPIIIISSIIIIVMAATWISCGLAWPIIPLMHIEGIPSVSQAGSQVGWLVGPCDSFGFTLASPVSFLVSELRTSWAEILWSPACICALGENNFKIIIKELFITVSRKLWFK